MLICYGGVVTPRHRQMMAVDGWSWRTAARGVSRAVLGFVQFPGQRVSQLDLFQDTILVHVVQDKWRVHQDTDSPSARDRQEHQ